MITDSEGEKDISMNSYCAREMLLFTGNSHPDLARSVANRLGIRIGTCSVYQKSNKESRVEIGESVRGKDIFLLQTGSRDVNDAIMELLIMAYACKTSCAHRIIGVVPYLPYSKQCKMRKRGSVVSKLVATLLCKTGLDHLITMDLHQREIQGFFDVPVDNLRASPFLIQYIQENIPDYRNAVIVAKTPASARKAQSFAERLRLGIAVIHGEPQEADSDQADGRNSPPPSQKQDSASLDWKNTETPLAHGLQEEEDTAPSSSSYSRRRNISIGHFEGLEIPMLTAKEKPPINVVGDVGGKIAIIVDDIIDDVDPFVAAANVLKDRGAYKVYVMASHGILSSDSPRILEGSSIDEVVVTNTVPHELQKLQCHKIKTVDISFILSEAIRRIHHGESMSHLFRNIALDE
ncbi:phosphoribosyl pyrophosphate synthase-associated protein 2-like [Styela clava]|uniref:phosphoribosyl pyrophosphate synthase-associated protein 2-like n=1 Tax=Styela clava TaxID=7725 RepID=UPI001939C4A6|nr:phosphoribosyl pyrophosphate synthase-associated protein 2-like [Styela clava]